MATPAARPHHYLRMPACCMVQQHCGNRCCKLQNCCPHLASLFCCTTSLLWCPLPPIDCCLQTIILVFDSVVSIIVVAVATIDCLMRPLAVGNTCCKEALPAALPLPISDAVACCMLQCRATAAAMLPQCCRHTPRRCCRWRHWFFLSLSPVTATRRCSLSSAPVQQLFS